jgi:hypothetical protein
MHSDLIGKIAKARQYANEPERLIIEQLSARFHGTNNEHRIALDHDRWSCDCTTFRLHATCAHVMAFQRIFAASLDAAARADVPLTMLLLHRLHRGNPTARQGGSHVRCLLPRSATAGGSEVGPGVS